MSIGQIRFQLTKGDSGLGTTSDAAHRPAEDDRAGRTSSPDVLVERAQLEQDLTALFVAVGCPSPNATVVVGHLLDADVAGVPTHGAAKVAGYISAVERGDVDPAAVPVERSRSGASVHLDGCRGFGQVGGVRAAELACQLAVGSGIACVAVRRLGHTGRLGAYAEQIAANGLVGICCASTPPDQRGVAWHGAREGRLGTNPIAYACPTGDRPIVADMSTSATSWGTILRARATGSQVPPGLIVDSDGQPTTDPDDYFAEPPGHLLPLGGAAAGHKGSALALLVELLATTFSGELVEDEDRGNNLFVLALAPDPGMAARAHDLRAYIRTAPPREPTGRVRVPGDGRQASATHLRLDAHVWSELVTVAARHGIDIG